jgi:hypothetical protein
VNDWAPAVRLLTRFRFGETGTGRGAVLPWFPVVGAGAGLASWILVWLCVWFGGPRAGALVAAAVVFGFAGWATGGRRYGAAVRLLESLPDGSSGPETSAYIRLAAFQGLIVLKLVSYGILAATGRGAWLVVAGAVSAAAAAHVLGQSRPREADAGDLWREWGHWIVAAGVAAVAGRLANALLPALCSVLVALLLPGVLVPVLGRDSNEPGSLAWLSMAEALELVILAIGALAALAA